MAEHHPELTVEFVNTTVENKGLPRGERYLFQTQMTIFDLPTVPYTLESLPDSFRYDRSLTAIGINCGVESRSNSDVLTTADTIVVERKRPEYTFDGTAPDQLDLGFDILATDPVPQLTALAPHPTRSGESSTGPMTRLPAARVPAGGWSAEMLAEAREAAGHHRAEVEQIADGVAILGENDVLRRAFQLMNEAMSRSVPS